MQQVNVSDSQTRVTRSNLSLSETTHHLRTALPYITHFPPPTTEQSPSRSDTIMYMEGQNRIWLAIQTNLSSLQVVEKLGCTDVTRILEDCEIKTK